MTFFKIPKRMNKLLISASHESDAINPDAFPPPGKALDLRENGRFTKSNPRLSETFLTETSTFVNSNTNQNKN